MWEGLESRKAANQVHRRGWKDAGVSADACSDLLSIPACTRVGWVHLKRLCRDEHAKKSSRAVRGPLTPTEVCLAATELLEVCLGGRLA